MEQYISNRSIYYDEPTCETDETLFGGCKCRLYALCPILYVEIPKGKSIPAAPVKMTINSINELPPCPSGPYDPATWPVNGCRQCCSQDKGCTTAGFVSDEKSALLMTCEKYNNRRAMENITSVTDVQTCQQMEHWHTKTYPNTTNASTTTNANLVCDTCFASGTPCIPMAMRSHFQGPQLSNQELPTEDTSAATASSNQNNATVITAGLVAGGALGLVAIVVALAVYRRRTKNNGKAEHIPDQPPQDQAPEQVENGTWSMAHGDDVACAGRPPSATLHGTNADDSPSLSSAAMLASFRDTALAKNGAANNVSAVMPGAVNTVRPLEALREDAIRKSARATKTAGRHHDTLAVTRGNSELQTLRNDAMLKNSVRREESIRSSSSLRGDSHAKRTHSNRWHDRLEMTHGAPVGGTATSMRNEEGCDTLVTMQDRVLAKTNGLVEASKDTTSTTSRSARTHGTSYEALVALQQDALAKHSASSKRR